MMIIIINGVMYCGKHTQNEQQQIFKQRLIPFQIH